MLPPILRLHPIITRSPPLFGDPEHPGNIRCQGAGDVDSRTFSAKATSTSDRSDSGKKLSQSVVTLEINGNGSEVFGGVFHFVVVVLRVGRCTSVSSDRSLPSQSPKMTDELIFSHCTNFSRRRSLFGFGGSRPAGGSTNPCEGGGPRTISDKTI